MTGVGESYRGPSMSQVSPPLSPRPPFRGDSLTADPPPTLCRWREGTELRGRPVAPGQG